MPYKDKQKKLECQKRYRDSHREQLRLAGRLYNKLHKEQHLETVKRYMARHPDRVKARYKKWYGEHAEKKRQYAHVWRINNPERRKETFRQYVLNNKEKIREYGRAYKARNRELLVAHQANRRARHYLADSVWTKQDIIEKYYEQNGRCLYCCKSIMRGEFHADHIIPLSKGGDGSKANLALACATCNLSKWNHSALDYALRLVS